MEGKLYKINNIYTLMVNDKMVASNDEDFQIDYAIKKLSLKNCQAVANGYDLDELAREACNITDPLRLDSQKYKQDPYFKIGFIKGFQKALELIGNKKFSEHHTRLMLVDMARFVSTKEMRDAWDFDIQKFHRDRDFFIDKQIQSLQKTEWDCTFNPDEKDSDGCLILKRK